MARLNDQLAALVTMPPAQLRAEWQRVRNAAPPPLPPDLLRRGIAQALQERVHGKLPASVRRRLERLVDQLERDGEVAAEREVVLKVGTRLARDWHGRTHHVLVLDDGFLFQDRRYTSLSRIAGEITGVAWSGPRFFGLKRRPKPFARPVLKEQARG